MKIITTLSFYRFILCSIILLNSQFSFATGNPVVKVNQLNGNLNQIKVDSVVTVIDSSLIGNTFTATNKVSLKLNESSPYRLESSFTASVGLHIVATRSSGVVTYDTILRINYLDSGTYVHEHAFYFKDAYSVVATVTSINTDVAWNVWGSIQVYNEISSVISQDFSCTLNAINSISHESLSSNTGNDQLLVSWADQVEADEYDLEWTYVDDSALISGRYGDPDSPNVNLLFDNNSSRVTVTSTSYKIPLIYDSKGHLFFRVRSAQLTPTGGRYEANWSTQSAALGKFDFDGHEKKLNWQATTTFAEEGKRKTVVQYFDGSLRNRQTVTKDNTSDSTIVAETFYDQQGRPVIQVLPAPSLENVLKYTQNFNQGINGSEYTTGNYDTLKSGNTYCGTAADSLSNTSGASQYYSTNNPRKNNGIHRFIPDAKGYPYTEVQYTQDNTGRISKQSGVGPVHQLGTGHETVYYYGTPSRQELDALFGTEAGYSSHYQKTMVKDANGQFSVSYVDMHGRTVATALAGTPTSAALDTLSSYSQESITETLLDSTSVVIKDLVMESKKGLLVPKAGLHTFNYELSPQSLSMEGCSGSICYDCLYDLRITISGSCNNEAFGGQPFDTLVSNFSLSSIDGTCNESGFSFSFAKYLTEGSYEITKELSVSRYGLDYYRDSIFAVQNTCTTIEEFMQEQRSLLAVDSSCTPECQSCLNSIGDWNSFRNLFLENTGITTDTAAYTGQAWKAYQESLAGCAALCDSASEYDAVRSAMLADVSAPSGQYANIDSTQDVYSIFYSDVDEDSNIIPIYQTVTDYRDEQGNLDSVYDESVGKFVKPQQLSPQAFSSKFRSSWAEALLPSHPEYCKLRQYDKASELWARRFEKIDTYQEAYVLGYLNPTNQSGSPYSDFNGWGGGPHPDPDPLRSISGYSTLDDSLRYFRVINGSLTMSMWGTATAMATCTQTADASCYTSSNNDPFDQAHCAGDLDMAWKSFRQMYLNARRNLLKTQVHANALCNDQPTDVELIAAHHQPHFSDGLTYLQANGINAPTSSADTATFNQAMRNRISANYDSTCRAYASQWLESLKNCGYNQDAKDTIINRLVMVCREGSDESHPFGSSSVAPASTYQFKNFEEVIENYNSTHSITSSSACNVDLITLPRPYNSQTIYSVKPVWNKPDSCECQKITDLYIQFAIDSAGYSGFSDFVEQKIQVTMTDSVLTKLLSLCNDTLTCNFLTAPILLPAPLQCYSEQNCVSCVQVDSVYQLFKTAYPNVNPSTTPFDTTDFAANRLFENFLNTRLGFTQTAPVYLTFLDSCSSVINSFAQYNKDSLLNILYNYNKSNFNYNKVDFFVGDGSGYSTNDPLKFFNNGVAYYPADVLGDTLPGYNALYALIGQNFCGASSYQKEYRFKFPGTEANGCCNTLIGPAGGGVVFNRHHSKLWLQAFTDEFNNHYGIHYIDTDTSIFTEIAVDSVSGNMEGFNKVRIKSELSVYSIYYNDSLIVQIPRDSTVAMSATATTGGTFFGTDFWADYYKIIADSQVVYFEDFNDPYTPAKPIESSLCITPPDCQVGFTAFFNTQTGSSYTFDQIDSIYLKYTGHPLAVCDTSARIIDSLSCASNHFTVSGVSPSDYHKVFKDGIAHVPVELNVNGQVWTSFNKLDTMCVDNGFTAEIRLKHPQDGRGVGTWDVFTLIRTDHAEINPEFPQSYIALPYAGYALIYPDTSYEFRNDSAFVRSFNDWRVLKYQAINNTYKIFIDDTLIKTVPYTGTISKIYFLGMLFKGNGASIDYYRVYDQDGVLRYVEDFQDCKQSPSNYPSQFRCDSTVINPSTIMLCNNITTIIPPVDITSITNCSDSSFFIHGNATELYKVYTDSLLGEFDTRYREKCLQAYKYESFTVSHQLSEYHYTLYYYDQAGNLVKTIPPKGVNPNRNTIWLDQVNAKRVSGEDQVPTHSMATQYRYNTLNQVVAQQTPDAGTSEFWYDRLGRLALSQNAKQKAVSGTAANRLFSYTKYDILGRITEVGQIKDNTGSVSVNDSLTRNPSALNSWLTDRSSHRAQFTSTYYDTAYTGLTGYDFRQIIQQKNLRNRVSYINYTDTVMGTAFSQATYYSYDIHGNVDSLLQDYGVTLQFPNLMNSNGNRFKKIVYDYDLISGKVNRVSYQPGWGDQVIHKYSYDAENRLTLVETSFDGKRWEKDARYEYYRHGPLARMTLGDQLVQGVDYAYTLQGWLKGVNSTKLASSADMGGDGLSGGINQFTARDAISFNLNYYDTSDYAAISGIDPFPGTMAGLSGNYRPLFNGNISSMAVNNRALGNVNNVGGSLMLYNYKYDQLNRLTRMDAYNGFNTSTDSWSGMALLDQFKERVSYDGNGNILTYLRHGHKSSYVMDNLTYNYGSGNNKLIRVTDTVPDSRYGPDPGDVADIDSQGANNYEYDEIGNLIKDVKEGLTNVKWSVYGKILEITLMATATNPVSKIIYTYDAQGNRISKTVFKNTGNKIYTWYVRDAQGNVMSTYTSQGNPSILGSLPLNLSERHIYGSGRLGMYTKTVNVDSGPKDMTDSNSVKYYRGFRQYEMSNHLGNVLATISDKKKGVDAASDGFIDYFDADITTAQDYYPFGMLMPGRIGYQSSTGWSSQTGNSSPENGLSADLSIPERSGNAPSEYTATNSIEFVKDFISDDGDTFTAYISPDDGSGSSELNGSSLNGNYRYGFNGKENDNEVKGTGNQQDYGMRIYDNRIGRFLSQDPLTKSFPWYTPYQFAGNTPIQAIDLDGEESVIVIAKSNPTYFQRPINSEMISNFTSHGNGTRTMNRQDEIIDFIKDKVDISTVGYSQFFTEEQLNTEIKNIIRGNLVFSESSSVNTNGPPFILTEFTKADFDYDLINGNKSEKIEEIKKRVVENTSDAIDQYRDISGSKNVGLKATSRVLKGVSSGVREVLIDEAKDQITSLTENQIAKIVGNTIAKGLVGTIANVIDPLDLGSGSSNADRKNSIRNDLKIKITARMLSLFLFSENPSLILQEKENGNSFQSPPIK